MGKKIFIDGCAGTTGLRIYDRLGEYDGIELISLKDDERKNPGKRKEALNSADVAFLCLPDEAAKESVSLIENENTVVVDTSTAHRTLCNWVYGFPELSAEFEKRLLSSKRIAVPGCHASGFISLVFPLIESGAVNKDALLSCFSLTGYSGGGKKMIAEYENEPGELLSAPRQYGVSQTHKHLKEMQLITGVENSPVFCPVVAPFYSGMEVTVPLFGEMLENGFNIEKVKELYKKKYTGPVVKYNENGDENGFISAAKLSGRDDMEISVFGNDERMILTARYDNLGKGASGAAIECLNLALGFEKTKGLIL